MSRKVYNDALAALDRADVQLTNRQPQEALISATKASKVDLGPHSNLCAVYYCVLALRELYRIDEAFALCAELDQRIAALSVQLLRDQSSQSLVFSCASVANEV